MPLYNNEIVPVITPAYNVEFAIGKNVVEPILFQEHIDSEMVFSDDCLKDSSANVMAQLTANYSRRNA